MTTYRVRADPVFVRDGDDAALPGHYEAGFTSSDGRSIRRYLTDRGRAELLRTLDAGDRTLTQDEFDDLTVEPSLDALVERAGIEGGLGG